MRIACVDKSATDRAKLQKFLDDAYEKCRATIGHLTLAQLYPVSQEELLLNSAPDAIIVGGGFSGEETYGVCREIRETFSNVPLLVLIQTNLYSLRTLKRFEPLCTEVLTYDDSPVRLVHVLSSIERRKRNAQTGKLVVVNGVKGGVGTTSITAGLAHAGQALGKSTVVFDLSTLGSLVQYMGAHRYQSPDYTSILVDGITPDSAMVERCLTTAPNGVTIFLPPAGGNEVRELWLRDQKRFEQTLHIIEILRDTYDVVLVDIAGAEGVLVFGLFARADTRLLVTSNDPAAIHLLSSALSRSAEIPGNSQVSILLTSLIENGLTKDDMLDFLFAHEHFQESMATLDPLPFDTHGKDWVGTGNTFYTECSPANQKQLEHIFRTLLLSVEGLRSAHSKQENSLRYWKTSYSRVSPKKMLLPSLRALPLRALPFFGKNPVGEASTTSLLSPPSSSVPTPTPLSTIPAHIDREQTEKDRLLLYESPQLVTDNHENNEERRL